MKTGIVLGGLAATLITVQVTAQRVENDDMYFNAKDREKLKVAEAEASVASYSNRKKTEKEALDENLNPTDTYSAKNINPEYISRSNSEQASEDELQYFVEGTPNTYDSYSAGNYKNFNDWNDNWNYRNGWYSPSMWDTWYSPYYGYCNPWMNPYTSMNPGWNLSFSYYWGSGWSNFYNPYSYGYYPGGYYSSYYNNWGYPYYSGSYSENNRPNYGKRPSRNSALVIPTRRITNPSSTVNNTASRSRQSSEEYYVKPSRRTPVAPSFDENSNTYSPQPRNRSNTTTNYTGTRSRNTPGYSSPPSRNSYGGGSRSTSGGSRSTGGGSRKRD